MLSVWCIKVVKQLCCHWICSRISILTTQKISQTCFKRPLKIDKMKVLKTRGRLMPVESIAECSKVSILQYIWPTSLENLSFCLLFESFLKTGLTVHSLAWIKLCYKSYWVRTFLTKLLTETLIMQPPLYSSRLWQKVALLCRASCIIWAATSENRSSGIPTRSKHKPGWTITEDG